MLDQHLSDIYTYCLHDSSIRALILIDELAIEPNRTCYHAVILATNLNQFLSQSEWLAQFGVILHAEQAYSFNTNPPWLRCCVVYQTGWCLQVWFLSTKEEVTHFKQRRIRLLIDKDRKFISEQIRAEAIKYNQWYELPDEKELKELAESFYSIMLQSARLLSMHRDADFIYNESRFIEPFLIHLIQWITYCGETFLLEEMTHIRQLVREVTATLPLKQKNTKWEQLSFYLNTGDELLRLFANIMNYHLNSVRMTQLKSFIHIIQNQVQMLDETDKMVTLCLY